MSFRIVLASLVALLSAAHAQSPSTGLKELLKIGSKGAEWSSLEHRHHYSDQGLHLLVKRVIDGLLTDPNGFNRELKQLTDLERSQIAFDSLDSRTDLIDLLSIELKLRLLANIERLPTKFMVDSSELWSVAKYRLKSALEPEVKRSSGVMLFREPGIGSHRALFVCGESLSMSEYVITKPIDIKCGARTFTLESSISQKHIDQAPSSWTLPQIQDPQLAKFTGMIGLSATISSTMQKLTTLYVEWMGGFKLTAQEDGSLKSFAENAMMSSDVLLFTVNLPDGNRFELSNKAEWGQRLIFERSTSRGKMIFEMLLPPLRTEENRERVRKENGVSFSFDEVSKIIEKRKLPFQLIDLTCFSHKHLKDWAEASLASQSKAPWLVGSERGQQAEGTLDLLPQLDLMLSVMKSIADDKRDETYQLLLNGSPLYRWQESLFGRVSSFLPYASFEPEFKNYLESSHRVVLWMKEKSAKSKVYRFNPYQ